jgi:hypothetical protein
VVSIFTAGFNNKYSLILSTQSICAVCMILTKTAIISLCSTEWLAFLMEAHCSLWGTNWKFECNVAHLQWSNYEAHLSSKMEPSSSAKSHLRFYEITRQGVCLQQINVKTWNASVLSLIMCMLKTVIKCGVSVLNWGGDLQFCEWYCLDTAFCDMVVQKFSKKYVFTFPSELGIS